MSHILLTQNSPSILLCQAIGFVILEIHLSTSSRPGNQTWAVEVAKRHQHYAQATKA